jgi:RNA polymerase sigma-70 factor, ECF subfamily
MRSRSLPTVLKKPRRGSVVVEVGKRDKLDQPTIAALGQLYELRYHRLLRVAEAIVGDPELAHDAVQEAFARAIRRRTTFRGDGTLEGWVWRTVINTARNARRNMPSQTAELSELIADPSANGSGRNDFVRALIATLPERQRLVLFLRYYADLDYDGIAAALEVKPGTVGATLNQAHAALRRHLEEVSQ